LLRRADRKTEARKIRCVVGRKATQKTQKRQGGDNKIMDRNIS
jgi:hypothetical protein